MIITTYVYDKYDIQYHYISCSHIMSYTHYGFPLILLEGVTAGFLYRSPRLRHFLLRHPGEIVLH